MRKLHDVNLAQKREVYRGSVVPEETEQGPGDTAESNTIRIFADKPGSSPTGFAAGYRQSLTICPCFQIVKTTIYCDLYNFRMSARIVENAEVEISRFHGSDHVETFPRGMHDRRSISTFNDVAIALSGVSKTR